MKKLFFAAFIIATSSFRSSAPYDFNTKSISKEFAKVKSDLYVCKYEVSNIDYRAFLSDILTSNQSRIYNLCLPDTLCWAAGNNKPYAQYYFRYPSFDDYPVVGISYEGAQEYCKWLTNKYNQDPKRKFSEVVFKLLSKEEWIFAASDGNKPKDYTWGSGFMQNNRKQWLCYFRHTTFVLDSAAGKYKELELNDRALISGPVKSFYLNSFGLYNMCGNAAEMIEQKGIAKGGSYNDAAYDVRISSEKKYDRPQAEIGFRVAMKIIKQ